MKKMWYEKLLFTLSLVGWTVCMLFLLYAAVADFSVYRLLGIKTQLPLVNLGQLKVPMMILTLSLFLMNLVLRKLSRQASCFLLLSLVPVPAALYAHSLPDFVVGQYLTAAISFFLVPFLFRKVYGDLICSGAETGKGIKQRKLIRQVLFWVCFGISALLTLSLIAASCSGHVLAQSMAFLILSFPYPLFLQLMLLMDSSERAISKTDVFLLDILSMLLSIYLLVRCFEPDRANSVVIIGLISLLAVFAALLICRYYKQNKAKKTASSAASVSDKEIELPKD